MFKTAVHYCTRSEHKQRICNVSEVSHATIATGCVFYSHAWTHELENHLIKTESVVSSQCVM